VPVAATGVEPEPEQMAKLYRDERVALLRLATLLTQDVHVAEDLVQDAFVSLGRRWHHLAEPSQAAGYLRTSVINGARSLHRRGVVARRHLPRLVVRNSAPADSQLVLSEEHRAVASAVRRLPRRQQQVITLRYWTDMSDIDIASTLGISPVSVRSLASRALAKLAEHLE
jgi:RNA polymerase sigma factor (sigma-70 family)